ncbi:MAG: hypothetical protein AAF228_12385 [Pseudomonadota bacterium]
MSETNFSGGSRFKIRFKLSRIKSIDGLTEDLTARGVIVKQCFPEIDLIIGEIPESEVRFIKTVEGVESIEPEGEFCML